MMTLHTEIGFSDNVNVVYKGLISIGFRDTESLKCLATYLWQMNCNKVSGQYIPNLGFIDSLEISNEQILQAIDCIEFRLKEFKTELSKRIV